MYPLKNYAKVDIVIVDNLAFVGFVCSILIEKYTFFFNKNTCVVHLFTLVTTISLQPLHFSPKLKKNQKSFLIIKVKLLVNFDKTNTYSHRSTLVFKIKVFEKKILLWQLLFPWRPINIILSFL